jgi:hypothetical protein
MPFRRILFALCLLATACSRAPQPTQTSASADQAPVAPTVQRKPQAEVDWSPERLEAGDAWLDCSPDYRAGDGRPVLSLAYLDLRKAMQDCRATGLLRLRYRGKVTASFAALAERVGKVADDLGIGKRILDIDSPAATWRPRCAPATPSARTTGPCGCAAIRCATAPASCCSPPGTCG